MFTVYALILIAQPEETARYLDLPDLRHGVKANLLSFVKGMNAEGVSWGVFLEGGLAYANKF